MIDKDDKQTVDALRETIRDDCRRVAMLDTLPEADRRGKYRNAIRDLKARLRQSGEDWLRLSMLGRFLVPTKNAAFIDGFFYGWCKSREFREMKRRAYAALAVGDADRFLQTASEIRAISRDIILGYGGYEDG